MDDRVVLFIAGLRAAGLRVSLAESQDAFRAVQHLGIMQREQGKAQAFDQSSAQAAPAPLPSNQANISAGIAGLFKHRARETPDPHATPVVKPSKGIFVVHVSGILNAGELSSATGALYAALNLRYAAHMTNASGDAAERSRAALTS